MCRALVARGADVQIVVCASALLERYGNVAAVVESEGYSIADRVYSVIEGATLETSAIEAGVLQAALARVFARLRPDAVLVCADRHEILAAAGAARMLEISLVHMQGGEYTGSVDNDIRDAVTQLADLHCVCTRQARLRVYSLTGDYDAIHVTGCPSIDLAKQALSEPPLTPEEIGGSGADIWTDDTYRPIVVLQHPVTNEADEAGEQMRRTLAGCFDAGGPVLAMWPGQDAGADAMSKAIRVEQGWLHTLRNLPPARFLRLLSQCACLVGNSSAGIREASYLGVPVVNVGLRQHGRERAANVIDVSHDVNEINRAVKQQIAHGRYPSSTLYGNGTAGEQTAEVICRSLTNSRSVQGVARIT